MADEIFENERLVSIYDAFDGNRGDLRHYINITHELGAKSIIDIGCGTGCLANQLAQDEVQVTAIDPARASLVRARQKLNANKVHWIIGDVAQLPDDRFDLALMTGNVAQVFVTDEEWNKTLKIIHQHLSTEGHFVFEARDPSKQAWLSWTRENTYQQIEVSEVGCVDGWCDLINVTDELVTFRWTYIFASDGKKFTSDSTLRFRSQNQLEHSLLAAGYTIKEIRDAPDRPGQEFVFIACAN